jgi:putative intracellular protease/amidase
MAFLQIVFVFGGKPGRKIDRNPFCGVLTAASAWRKAADEARGGIARVAAASIIVNPRLRTTIL